MINKATSSALLGLALTSLPVMATVVNLVPTNDASIWNRDATAGWSDTNFGTSTDLDVYHFDANINAYSYLQFDMSGIPDGATVNSVTLTLTKIANISNGVIGASFNRNDTIISGRVAIYGLTSAAGNTPQNWDETTITFANTGLEITKGTNVDTDPFGSVGGRSVDFGALETVTGGITVSLTDTAVNSFVQGRFDDNKLVTFMVDNPDATAGRGFAFGSRENAGFEPTLSIDFTPVPEPSIALLGGLGLLGLIRRRRA